MEKWISPLNIRNSSIKSIYGRVENQGKTILVWGQIPAGFKAGSYPHAGELRVGDKFTFKYFLSGITVFFHFFIWNQAGYPQYSSIRESETRDLS